MIRAAESADLPAVLEIWNHAIRETITTFNSREKTLKEVQETLAQKQADDMPFLLAETDVEIVGFATYGQFRGGVGYRYSVEHSIFLSEAAKGKGLGRALLAELEGIAKSRGMHSMIAGISGENSAAIAFHARLGYRDVARVPEVGHKFGRWFNLVLMQKML
ncbi:MULTISPECIES: GNAT family N-acetyltransferase [Halocynthiibacter]|uniref:GNAT family N-acetyltransferase n=1 Tax=Halocynthiibacter halioticoli TaxID=2986804 RepID=A0AAE3J234_9RHOB|nr:MULTISPECIES: GNAT family N-acetyltransferase [Halocynthiibacter]MCV6823787.1 GNAT family N-acetyltransferase [Halocynthiibacter halioticoli]MCW4056788.1 GNAT family N-acetyltransferase [Halocynthiibacter sp. SDUM655004]